MVVALYCAGRNVVAVLRAATSSSGRADGGAVGRQRHHKRVGCDGRTGRVLCWFGAVADRTRVDITRTREC